MPRADHLPWQQVVMQVNRLIERGTQALPIMSHFLWRCHFVWWNWGHWCSRHFPLFLHKHLAFIKGDSLVPSSVLLPPIISLHKCFPLPIICLHQASSPPIIGLHQSSAFTSSHCHQSSSPILYLHQSSLPPVLGLHPSSPPPVLTPLFTNLGLFLKITFLSVYLSHSWKTPELISLKKKKKKSYVINSHTKPSPNPETVVTTPILRTHTHTMLHLCVHF